MRQSFSAAIREVRVKLLEYQAKEVFAARGIPTPEGEVVSESARAAEVARALGGATVLKPQLSVKGRGKVGGIGFADTPEQAEEQARRLLGSTVKGERVERLLVEAKADIQRELYVAVVVDYAARRPVIMASRQGGVEIEQVAQDDPDAIVRVTCSLLSPPSEADLEPIRLALGDEAARVAATLYEVFRDYEAELVEINPLVETPGGLMAVDGVLNVNEPAVARHPELSEYARRAAEEDPLAAEARSKRWTFIDLGGDVAILSSGAGLTMTIVDLLEQRSIKPANFLDTAQFDEQGIYQAFDLLRRARKAKVWLINIFAGLNRCDRLAQGIRSYLADHPIDEPVVVRMVGNFEAEGHAILREIGVDPVRGLEEAIDRCAALVGSSSGGAP
jgi:succinyl-CoA synthetase beta subunit